MFTLHWSSCCTFGENGQIKAEMLCFNKMENQWKNSIISRIIWVCTDNLNNKIFKVIILKICTASNLVHTF